MGWECKSCTVCSCEVCSCKVCGWEVGSWHMASWKLAELRASGSFWNLSQWSLSQGSLVHVHRIAGLSGRVMFFIFEPSDTTGDVSSLYPGSKRPLHASLLICTAPGMCHPWPPSSSSPSSSSLWFSLVPCMSFKILSNLPRRDPPNSYLWRLFAFPKIPVDRARFWHLQSFRVLSCRAENL